MDAPGSILRRRGLKAKKSWGQNFLGDPEILERIADAARVGPGDAVVELGAGLGHLTRALLDTGARVIAVERDRDMVAALHAEFPEESRLELREANAATLRLSELAEPALINQSATANAVADPTRILSPTNLSPTTLPSPLPGERARMRRPHLPVDPPHPSGPRFTVVGNLPYQLSSAILFAMLDQRHSLKRLIFLLQEEFVVRLAAAPGGRDYGVLSVQAQAVADVRQLFQVPSAAFYPRPAVDSAVVELIPLAEPRVPAAANPLFAQVVRGAFQQRRKTVANALLGAGFAHAKTALEAAGIDPIRRAETLAIEDFGRLTEALLRAG